MLGPPSSSIEIGIHALAFGIGQIVFGYLVADMILGKGERDRVLPWALALPAAIGWVTVLQIAHWMSGGQVWLHVGVVRGLTGALLLTSIVVKAIRLRRRDPAGAPVAARLAMLVMGCAAVALWSYPIFEMVPLGWKGDMNSHLGWAHQLLNGEPTPSILVTGDATNSYPWLFHAALAWVSTLVPGGTPLHSLGPMQVSIAIGTAFTLFGLGRALSRRWQGGAAAALFGALSGGFGYLISRGPGGVETPRDEGAALTYFGDLLLKRSYNIGFHNISPPFPRDLAYCLTAAFLLLLVVGLVRERSAFLLAAGLALGAIGLTGGETFIVAFAVGAMVSLVSGKGRVLKTAAVVLLPALAIWSLWIGPVIASYSEYGGFLNTAAAPVVLPPLAVAFSWGLATPLAVFGAVAFLPTLAGDPRVKVAVSQVVVAAAVLASVALVPLLFGEGFATLGRQHRYWPLLHLGVVLFAALGAARLFEMIQRHSQRLVALASAIVIVLAVPSPILASLAVPDLQTHNVLLRKAILQRDTVLDVLAAEGRARCVVAAPAEVSAEVVAYTGYRVVRHRTWRGPRQAGVRWDRLPNEISNQRRLSDNAAITSAGTSIAEWKELVKRYAVDLVVVRAENAGEPAFADYPQRSATGVSRSFVIVRTSRCGR